MAKQSRNAGTRGSAKSSAQKRRSAVRNNMLAAVRGGTRPPRSSFNSTLPLPAPTAQRRQVEPAITGTMIEHVCALVDPFCDRAIGTKYPDNSSARSLAFSMHYMVDMSTNVNGSAGNVFLPGWTYGYSIGSVVGTTISLTTLTPNTNSGLNPTSFRIVSGGLRIRNVCAPLNASGLLQIRGLASQFGVTYASMDASNFNCDFYRDIPLQSVNMNGYTEVTFNRVEEIDSRKFNEPTLINPSSATNVWASPGFGGILVSVMGGPASTAVLNIEYIMHFELNFGDTDAMSVVCTPPRAPNSMLAQVASKVATAAGHVFSEASKDIATVTKQVARSALREALVNRLNPAALVLE